MNRALVLWRYSRPASVAAQDSFRSSAKIVDPAYSVVAKISKRYLGTPR